MRRRSPDAEPVTEATLWASIPEALRPTNEGELDEPSPALAAWLARRGFDEVDLITTAPYELFGTPQGSPEILITPNTARVNGVETTRDEAIAASRSDNQ
jgi:hypothetical protein